MITGPTFFYANGTPFTGNMQVFFSNDCYPLTGNVIVGHDSITTTTTTNPAT